jgi:hypothetical protein
MISYYQYLVIAVFIIICILWTLFSNARVARVQASHNKLLVAASILIMRVRDIPEEHRTQTLNNAIELFEKTFNINIKL